LEKSLREIRHQEIVESTLSTGTLDLEKDLFPEKYEV